MKSLKCFPVVCLVLLLAVGSVNADQNSELQLKLLRIVVPEIELNETPMGQVFELLTELARECDRDPHVENRGVRFALALNNEDLERPVSIKGKHVTLLEILHQVSQSGRIVYSIRNNVLVVTVPSRVPAPAQAEKV